MTTESCSILDKTLLNFGNSTEIDGEFSQEMNISHLLTIAGVLFVLYILIMIVSYCKLGTSVSHYKKMPRQSMDIGRYRLSKQMEKKAFASRQRMKRMVPKPYEASDKSYGVVLNVSTNEYSLLNYQATVAMSYKNLDEDIGKLYPNLKRNNKQDLRTYVKFLQSKFPKLTDTICEDYVKTYELARFSDHEWTAEMFEEWETFFRNFTNALTLPSDNHPSIMYPNNFKGNQTIEPNRDYEDTYEDEVLNIPHNLEDSDWYVS